MLEPTEMLQIDATIITGILILFTITSYKISKSQLSEPRKVILTPTRIGATIMIPFLLSAGFELLRTLDISWFHNYNADIFSVSFPMVGFVYLGIFMIKLARFEVIEKDKD